MKSVIVPYFFILIKCHANFIEEGFGIRHVLSITSTYTVYGRFPLTKEITTESG